VAVSTDSTSLSGVRRRATRVWIAGAVVFAALVLGGVVKGIVSIGVPLVAMPILSQFLPIKQAVLLLSMPIILGNIPQALEGGEMLPTVRRIAAPLIGTVLGNIAGVTVLIKGSRINRLERVVQALTGGGAASGTMMRAS